MYENRFGKSYCRLLTHHKDSQANLLLFKALPNYTFQCLHDLPHSPLPTNSIPIFHLNTTRLKSNRVDFSLLTFSVKI